jgi:alginate O-acetyltransferase complex protein AlgJ
MEDIKQDNPNKQDRARKVILALFVLIFLIPCICTPPWLVYDKYFSPKSKKMLEQGRPDEHNIFRDLAEFSWDSWMNGRFQEKFNRDFNETFAFRKVFIRFNNQIYYSLFDKSYMNMHLNAMGIVVGKEKQLYELIYVKDYIGQTKLMSPDETRLLAAKISDVQTLMRRRGVTFIVLVTPGKASIYPEFIPDSYRRRNSYSGRNYEHMVRLFRDYGVVFVDGIDITLGAKQETDMPLFCRGSSHWNSLGAYYTVRRLIEESRRPGGINIARVELDGVTVDNKPQGSDRDLAALLHTIFMPTDYPTPHPFFRRFPADIKPAGSIVIVGGSFNHRIVNMLNEQKIFAQMDFYYYYRRDLRTFPKDIKREKAFSVEKLDWEKDIFSRDIVVLEINEAVFQGGHVDAFLEDALRNLVKKPSLK